ncbi:FkbM family methyltransferase [Sphingobacterium sp. SGG-5]|uniref:FkbM family methyltransferase n=1 Tax=Sphingobacterium sp. SGG-5 TaxID=2710881 RepID=UPI0013EADB14|nr:FkbM family methyltransferase [Sphingobacterium sp. SGG-5]NGM60385.1 FkbM family methyltransferase [Sphingobacterium sp. SGG-5]
MADLKPQIKHWLNVLSGKSAFIRVEDHRDKVWYGSDYGGFYVDPSQIPEEAIVYSFGIGQDISFDKAILSHHRAEVFGFDPTPKSIAWIAEEAVPENFHFFPFGLGVETGMVRFNLPKNKSHVSGSVHAHSHVNSKDCVDVVLKSFKDIVGELGHSSIDVLKMDIEGSEFSVMESVLNSGVNIGQIVVEIHEKFFDDGKKRVKRFLELLKAHNYVVFGISDTYQEVSFIKR